jgi:hypothetical protein
MEEAAIHSSLWQHNNQRIGDSESREERYELIRTKKYLQAFFKEN